MVMSCSIPKDECLVTMCVTAQHVVVVVVVVDFTNVIVEDLAAAAVTA